MSRAAGGGAILIVEDSPGRLQRLRAALPAGHAVQAFARAPDAIAWLARADHPLTLICLDCHLGPREAGRGMDVAIYLAALPTPACPVLVHSSDTGAAATIVDLLVDRGWTALAAPFEGGGWPSALQRLLGP